MTIFHFHDAVYEMRGKVLNLSRKLMFLEESVYRDKEAAAHKKIERVYTW